MHVDRVIGSYSQGKPGPLLFCIGGIHGNEPAGVGALRRVLSSLESHQPSFAGKFIGLAGNVEGLNQEKRYIHRDLNRLWSEEEIARVKGLEASERNSEEKELIELLRFIDASIDTPYDPKVYVDLHTTSAPGGLFSIVTDDATNRRLAEPLRAPLIFNLVTELALTTNRFFDNRGLAGLAYEAGQHDDPASIDVHEAAIWTLLVEIGCLSPADIPDFEQLQKRLLDATAHLYDYMRVCYRHPITKEDHFVMQPDYVNFQTIQKGELLAHDKDGPILSPCDGQVLMPLYQKQGEDGFFVVAPLERPPV